MHIIGSDGRMVLRQSTTFVYLDELPVGKMATLGDAKCIATVGDYVSVAKDFSLGVKNVLWGVIHEHMMKSRPQGREYFRKGRLVGWAADFVFLDLPTGGVRHPSPSWDVCTEDHVRHGLALASSTLSDNGWLLVMASFGGNSFYK